MPFHFAFARAAARAHDHQTAALAAELLARGHRVTDLLRLGDARPDLIVWRDPAGLELARRLGVPDVRLAVTPVDPDDPQPAIACFPRTRQPRGELVADHVLFAGRLGPAHERPLSDPEDLLGACDRGSGGADAAADRLETILTGDRRSRPSAEELFAAALASDEDDEANGPLLELQERADHATYAMLCRELESPDAERRVRAAQVLGKLGQWAVCSDAFRYRPFGPATVDRLMILAHAETDADVLWAIGCAFGGIEDPRAIPALLRLRHHEDADVRWGAVHGLLGHEDDTAVAALIELSEDADDDVRHWATFGLGTMIDRDTSAVRAALMARLDDPAARDQAIAGLVERGLMVAPPDGDEA